MMVIPKGKIIIMILIINHLSLQIIKQVMSLILVIIFVQICFLIVVQKIYI